MIPPPIDGQENPAIFKLTVSSFPLINRRLLCSLAASTIGCGCLSAQELLLGSWDFENTLAHGASAPAVIAAPAAEANLAASAAYTGDFHTGTACREYSGAALTSSSSPTTGSRVSFTLTAAENADLTIHALTWWAKTRSFATGTGGTHNTARVQLYWSIDGYTAPISPELNPITDQQLSNGSWFGDWVMGSSAFSPVTLSAGQSIGFRLVMWDSTTSSQKHLRLDNLRIHGTASSSSAPEFDTLRVKWRDMLTGGITHDPADPLVASRLSSINESAASWQNSLNREIDRAHLWPDAASTTISADFNECYNRVLAMALAWATPGCALYQDTALRDDILGAIDWMNAKRYFAGKSTYNNWWHWQIGAPQRLGDILVLMHDALGTTRLAENLATLDFFLPGAGGWMTGANRSDKCLATAVHGILSQNPARMAQARDQLTPVFAYVNSGDGFRSDGSFIQHTAVAYTGSYGAELIKGVSRLYSILQGSPWNLTDPQHENLFAWIEHGFAPLFFRGAMPDHVRGRAVSRRGSTDHGIGHYIMRSILMIANAAPPDRGTPIRAWLRDQALSDTSRGFDTGSPLAELSATRELMADTTLPPAPPPPRHIRFQEMDRVVHRRSNHAFGLSMSSSRVYTYESINNEHLRGWFTGDGMLTFHNGDLSQFENDFWPTVDPYHLPGVTNPTAPRANASGEQKYTSQDWVGGAGLAEFGSAGMRLQTWTGDLTGRKSWFFLDDEVVCLGTDITGNSPGAIHTTVENRRLSDAAAESLVMDGITAPVTLGWEETVANPSWFALEGTGGVFFPSPTTVRIKREARTASWYDINRGYPDTPVTRNYLTAWIDHGVNPVSASYAYVLLPDANAIATEAYSTSPDVQILSNDPSVQAVQDQSTGVTAAHFWHAGGGTAGPIASNGPSAVILRQAGATLEIAVADPTWKRSTPLLVTIAGPVNLPVALDPAITVLSTSPDLQLSVAVSGARGRSITATFTDLVPTDDFVSIPPGEPVLLDVLANDVSLSGGAIHLAAVGSAANGQTAIRGGAVSYLPAPGFTGSDLFIYQIESGGIHSSATVRIEVSELPGPAVPVSVTASAHDGNLPSNTLDGNPATRWSAFGDGQWIQYDFGVPRFLDAVSLAFFQGESRSSGFDVAHSVDGVTWVPVITGGASSGASSSLERFEFPLPVFARHLRIVGHGNNLTMWNSITEATFQSHRNLPPSAPALVFQTPESIAITKAPLATSSDPDSLPGPLRLLHLGNPQSGTAGILGDMIEYAPVTGFVGEENLIYQISDGHRVAEGGVSIVISRPTTFEGYINAHFTDEEMENPLIAGPMADPDADGLATAIEFLTGSNPQSASPFPALPLRTSVQDGHLLHVPIRNHPDGTPREFSDTSSPSTLVDGIRFRVEASTDLTSWPSAPVSIANPDDDLPPAPEGCTWHAFHFGHGGKAFIRLAAGVEVP
jgi:hyaluronate lyase